jgi:hypothetical protein
MMSHLGITQLDSLLHFSGMHLLIFSAEWKLVELRPNHRTFLGWDEADFQAFRFEQNFLSPNSIELSEFLGHFQQKNYLIKNYYWRDANQHVNGPFETYFRLKKDHGLLKLAMAFIKIQAHSDKLEILPEDKHKLYLAEPLPGLIHNVFGPLGTISGRIEILKNKYPQYREFDELLKMTQRIQKSLKNVSYKMTNERQSQPVFIDLNEFLKEELIFLQSDLFFRHQVTRNVKFNPHLPKGRTFYASLSGILSEFYYFFRKFIFDDQEYLLQAETFSEERKIGFYLNFLGNFQVPQDLNIHFPFDLQGDAHWVARQQLEGLDIPFLAYCLTKNEGTLEISGRKDMMTLRFLFPAQLP